MDLIKKIKPGNRKTNGAILKFRYFGHLPQRLFSFIKSQLYGERRFTLRWALTTQRDDLKEQVSEAMREPESKLLDELMEDIQPNLSKATRRFYVLQVALLLSVGLCYLASSGVAGVKVGPAYLPTSEHSLDFYLFVSAMLFAATCGLGFLRKFFLEIFDYIKVRRYQSLWTVGLQELKLPPNHVLNTETALEEGGRLEQLLGWVLKQLRVAVFMGLPLLCLFALSTGSLVARLDQGEYLQAMVLIMTLVILLIGTVVLCFSQKLEFSPEANIEAS